VHYIIIINTQFIKTVCFESNMIHLQQCFCHKICRYICKTCRYICKTCRYIILYYIILYLSSVFAEIISRKRMSHALYHYSTYIPYFIFFFTLSLTPGVGCIKAGFFQCCLILLYVWHQRVIVQCTRTSMECGTEG
jgi:hypothetical protein